MTENTRQTALDQPTDTEKPASDKRMANESHEEFAERRIREAEAEGAFNNLPGFGKPIPGIDLPHDENRWLREKLKREQVNSLPPILAVKLEVEKALENLQQFTTEYGLRKRLIELNEKIREAHFSPIPGPPTVLLPLEIEKIVSEWKTSRNA